MTKLKRTLSLPVLTLYGLGNILGAGIYVLVGKVAGEAGLGAPLSFLVAMIIAGLTAFSYMELSSRFPKSAGSAVYVHEAFNVKFISLIVGLALVAGGITSAATLSLGFAGYLQSLVSVPTPAASLTLLVVLGLVAAKGIGESARMASVFTLVEIAGLVLVVWLGRTHLGEVEPTQFFAIDQAIGLNGILLGAFLAFYAFIGFEDMVNVSEEVKNPRRAMPAAILISLISATVLYLLVTIVSVAAVVPAELAESSAPLSLVIERVSSLDPKIISVIGLAAALNGVIVQIIMGSRMLYGLSQQGLVTARFSKLSAKSQTPLLATSLVVALMMAATVLLPLVSLAQLTSLLVLVIFILVNVSLLVIKRRSKPRRNITQIPTWVPVLGVLSSTGITVFQILSFLQ